MSIKNDGYDFDKYGTVLPTTNTAMAVAKQALDGGAVVNLYLAEATSMNCLFVVAKHGSPKDSFKLKDLNVAIDRIGYFQFNIPRGGSELHWGYVNEKLGVGMQEAETLAKFITEVSDFIVAIHKIKSGDIKL